MSQRPATVDDYIAAAPPEGQAHLHRMRALLKAAAPMAQEVIKWGHPFFVEPRYLFSFSAHKAHLSFAPGAELLAAFKDELKGRLTTRNYLKIPYAEPMPEALIRKMAARRVEQVAARADDSFW